MIAWHTSSIPRTPRMLSYWPAAEASSVSSFVADERTATTGSPSRPSSRATASRRERPISAPVGVPPVGMTKPSGTGSPSRSSAPSIAALPPESVRVASESRVSITPSYQQNVDNIVLTIAG